LKIKILIEESVKELIEYFRREAEKEKEYAKALEETASKSKNVMLKTIMKAVSLDSMKHALLYEALVELLENPALITEEENRTILGEIERHIGEEAEAVEELERLLEDERIRNEPPARFIVEMLLRDELFHHSLLRRLHQAVIEPRTFKESDLWEQVWKDAAWHGTSGG
jgi:rubrerythrin